MKINLNLLEDLKFDGVDYNDYPDFSDAFLVSASQNEVALNDQELDTINEQFHDFVALKLRNQEDEYPSQDEPLWSKDMWGGGIADNH